MDLLCTLSYLRYFLPKLEDCELGGFDVGSRAARTGELLINDYCGKMLRRHLCSKTVVIVAGTFLQLPQPSRFLAYRIPDQNLDDCLRPRVSVHANNKESQLWQGACRLVPAEWGGISPKDNAPPTGNSFALVGSHLFA